MLTVSDLSITYNGLRAVDAVSFTIEKNETVCLIGESGCGKSSVLYALMQLSAGKITGNMLLDGQSLTDLSAGELRTLRGSQIALIPQEVRASLNPLRTVGGSLCDVLRAHQSLCSASSKEQALDLLRSVGLPSPESLYRAYPHQLSGGMCQRILIACALANQPELLLADEPTASLDATVRAQIVRLLHQIRRERQLSMLIATHDLAVVRALADRILVMYAGLLVEAGTAQAVLTNPRHPYTKLLLSCEDPLASELPQGEPPSPSAYPSGCRFHPRCPSGRCADCAPDMRKVDDAHWVRCFKEI